MFRNKALLILLAVLTLAFSACQASGTKQTDDGLMAESLIMPEEANYKTVQVKVADYQKVEKGNAAVVFPYGAALSMDKSAKLQQILVSSGDLVEAGDVIAVFEPENRDTERADLQLRLQRAQEALETGKQDRLEAIAEMEEDNAKLQGYELKIAEVQLEKLRISYEQFVYSQQRTINSIAKSLAEVNEVVSENVLVAPFAGKITNVSALFPGDQVPAGRVVASMSATEYCWGGITDKADELIYNRDILFKYQRRHESYELTGTIVAAPGILPNEVSFSYALADVEAPVPLNTVEGTVEYTFVTEEVKSALVVDRRAIHKEDGKSFVYLLEDGVVKKRYVQVASNNTEVAWILDGLTEGQSVMVE